MTEDQQEDCSERDLQRFGIELSVIHPTMDPEDITAALGLTPTRIFRVGDLRMTPRGHLTGGKYPNSRWRHSARYETRDQHFADKVTLLVDRLMSHKAFLTDLRDTGGSAQVIVKFLGDDGYFGDKVPLDTIAKMADLRLDFSIEVFAVPQN